MYLALALLSSLVLGSADFVGGAAARRARAAVVVVWSNAAGLLAALVLVVLAVPGAASLRDLGWGAAAGISGSFGAVLLYRALACGVMSVVAPSSAAAAAAAPVSVGIALGERISGPAAVGVVAALGSLVLLTHTSGSGERNRRPVARSMAYAVLAGISFGIFLVLLAQTSTASSLWPLVAARFASLGLLVALALVRRQRLDLAGPSARLALLAGMLDMASNVLFLVAVRGGQLVLVGLLASLSPLGTVGLARLVLRERIRAVQGLGAALAMGSVLLLALA
ncbi:MAG TPA: EamA family transporter [Propionibacteriaceae bacterium]|nr:EamA family transporter [Propionibacteriaceae bacterium]